MRLEVLSEIVLVYQLVIVMLIMKLQIHDNSKEILDVTLFV